jgi:hypothetical protein
VHLLLLGPVTIDVASQRLRGVEPLTAMLTAVRFARVSLAVTSNGNSFTVAIAIAIATAAVTRCSLAMAGIAITSHSFSVATIAIASSAFM